MRTTVLALVTAILALTAACGSDADSPSDQPSAAAEAPQSSDSSDTGADAAADSSGAYVSLADYESDPDAYGDSSVVYFFSAPWCSSCQQTEKAIADAGLPDGLTLVKIDFDSETDLRQEYGVTVQHTFVQVDGSGDELKKWTGSISGEDILAQTV